MKSGDILGSKYRLVQRIGEGAMGEVWSGENQSTGRKVALKLMIHPAHQARSSQKNNTAELRQRMLREARACGKLSHRNIVQIFDVGETPSGDPFLVLELLRGRTLSERLKDTRRMDPTMAARIGSDIASALAVAHAAQIIHRDLKPANIFLHQEENDQDERFVVKVLDFGVCKSLDGGADGPATVTNVAVGSPVYMSPEQVALQKDLDGRTDLWSLGIILYEMLTGGRPFSGSVDDVVRQIILTRINSVPLASTKVRDVPPEFDAIVARCLENDRGRRYGDAAELSQALRAIAKAGVTDRAPRLASRPSLGDMQFGVSDVISPTSTPLPGTTVHVQGPTGTHLLPASGVNVSPAPAWRNEMAQWRAQRDVIAATRAAMLEAVQGGTQALDSAAMLGNAGKQPEPTGTTSALAALAQETVKPRESLVFMSAARMRSHSPQTKLALAGLVVFSVLVFVVLAVHAASAPDEPEPSKSKPTTSANPVAPRASMVQPRQTITPEAVVDKPAAVAPTPSAAPQENASLPMQKAAPTIQRQTAPKQGTPKPSMTTCKVSGGKKTCTKSKSPWALGNPYSPGKL